MISSRNPQHTVLYCTECHRVGGNTQVEFAATQSSRHLDKPHVRDIFWTLLAVAMAHRVYMAFGIVNNKNIHLKLLAKAKAPTTVQSVQSVQTVQYFLSVMADLGQTTVQYPMGNIYVVSPIIVKFYSGFPKYYP